MNELIQMKNKSFMNERNDPNVSWNKWTIHLSFLDIELKTISHNSVQSFKTNNDRTESVNHFERYEWNGKLNNFEENRSSKRYF